MELTKLIVENCVQLIHYIIWPIVVLFILFFFQDKFRDMIDRVEEILYKKLNIKFREKITNGENKKGVKNKKGVRSIKFPLS